MFEVKPILFTLDNYNTMWHYELHFDCMDFLNVPVCPLNTITVKVLNTLYVVPINL